jgi:hypothetical protein
MARKFIYLFLALLLPGLIFVFLKRFGRNEFAIPVYFEQSADSLNSVCGTHYSQPYRLPDSVLHKSGWKDGTIALFVFPGEGRENGEFGRALDGFDSTEFQRIDVTRDRVGQGAYERWTSCVFMLKPPFHIVLVDAEKRIRGYYANGSREEADRLGMEMEILLRKY